MSSKAARALADAAAWHGDRLDKGGQPYWLHPLRVVAIVSLHTDDEDVLAAAALHDVVEDEGVSLFFLAGMYGDRVYNLVDLVSRRDGETYFDCIGRIVDSADYGAIIIKLADIRDNMNPWRPHKASDSLKTRYESAHARLMVALEDLG